MYPKITSFKDSEEICAVAVGKTSPHYSHCGILYASEKDGTKHTFFLHLGSPLVLHNNPENDDGNQDGYTSKYAHFIWSPFIDVPIQLIKLTRTKCSLIAKHNKALPYGIFHDESTQFDAEGNLKLGLDSSGLTCGTFIKVVLKGCRIDVLDDVDWPDERETDVDWLELMLVDYTKYCENLQADNKLNSDRIEVLKKVPNSTSIINDLKSRINKNKENLTVLNRTIKDIKKGKELVFKRYRPEELSAASFLPFDSFPVKYEYEGNIEKKGAGIMGKELLALLDHVE